tara:strand:- start:5 stop:121 length:117 start_codon:yes stop_codon:yes gene_type:complete
MGPVSPGGKKVNEAWKLIDQGLIAKKAHFPIAEVSIID